MFPPEFHWPRYLSRARVLLAAVALLLAAIDPRRNLLFVALLGVFLVASILAELRGKARIGMLALLALFADTVYFLIVAYYGSPRLLWLATVFFLYLLTEALAFYGPVEVGVIGACSTAFCAILPSQRIHLPAVVLAGVLACGFAVSKRRLNRRTELLAAQLAEAQRAAEKARDEERQRIASDFHDGPLQSFISLQMRLEILRKLLDRDFEAGVQDLKQLQSLAQSQVRDLRAFVHSMRPVDVDGANLIATARRTAEGFQKESGIRSLSWAPTNRWACRRR